MTAALPEPTSTHEHQHSWRLEDVEYDELVGAVSRFECACGSVWFR
jgi:hypothetical protein